MWVVPSSAWRAEILLLREVFDLNMHEAVVMLKKYGTAEAAFEGETRG